MHFCVYHLGLCADDKLYIKSIACVHHLGLGADDKL